MRIWRRKDVNWEFIEPEPEVNVWNMLTLISMGAIIGTAEDLILGVERMQDWNYYASRFVD